MYTTVTVLYFNFYQYIHYSVTPPKQKGKTGKGGQLDGYTEFYMYFEKSV